MKLHRLPCLCLLLTFLIRDGRGQGSLTPPPGPPVPGMKSLAQIEPRTPVTAVATPGDATAEFIISQPGSYFLTGGFTVAKSHGIRITADRVTLDLSGFEVKSAGSPGNIAIVVQGNDCTISRGGLLYFVQGISGSLSKGGHVSDIVVTNSGQTGIQAGLSWIVENCRTRDTTGTAISGEAGTIVSRCTATGANGAAIVVNDGAQIRDCSARSGTSGVAFTTGKGCQITGCIADANTGPQAILAGDGTLLRDCTAMNNSVGDAVISAGRGCSVSNCTVQKNQSTNVNCGGISAGLGSMVTSCVALDTTVTGVAPTVISGHGFLGADATVFRDCLAMDNTGHGFKGGDYVTVTGCRAHSNGGPGPAWANGINCGIAAFISGCTATQNYRDGINCAAKSMVIGNQMISNIQAGPIQGGSGIRAAGGGSRIEGNHAQDNAALGIYGTATDVIIDNTSAGHSTNYNPPNGTNFGTLQTPAASTNPVANH